MFIEFWCSSVTKIMLFAIVVQLFWQHLVLSIYFCFCGDRNFCWWHCLYFLVKVFMQLVQSDDWESAPWKWMKWLDCFYWSLSILSYINLPLNGRHAYQSWTLSPKINYWQGFQVTVKSVLHCWHCEKTPFCVPNDRN